MKNFLLLAIVAFVFTACNDNNDSNQNDMDNNRDTTEYRRADTSNAYPADTSMRNNPSY